MNTVVFKKIGLISKQQDPRVKATLETLIAYFQHQIVTLYFDAVTVAWLNDASLTATPTHEMGQHCDLIMIAGGDGTLLLAARELAAFDVPLLGINLGHLGFLTDIPPEQLHQCLDEILGGHYQAEKRFLLQASVYRNEQQLCCVNALNDVVLHKWNTAHMVGFEIRIEGRLVTSQQADGLIIATPTGSTAYALSGGGPVVHPSLNALVLVSICPHTFSNRPLVINANSEIEISICHRHPTEAQLTCDGVLCQDLQNNDRIVIKKQQSIRLIHPENYDYYTTLRTKLGWTDK